MNSGHIFFFNWIHYWSNPNNRSKGNPQCEPTHLHYDWSLVPKMRFLHAKMMPPTGGMLQDTLRIIRSLPLLYQKLLTPQRPCIPLINPSKSHTICIGFLAPKHQNRKSFHMSHLLSQVCDTIWEILSSIMGNSLNLFLQFTRSPQQYILYFKISPYLICKGFGTRMVVSMLGTCSRLNLQISCYNFMPHLSRDNFGTSSIFIWSQIKDRNDWRLRNYPCNDVLPSVRTSTLKIGRRWID